MIKAVYLPAIAVCALLSCSEQKAELSAQHRHIEYSYDTVSFPQKMTDLFEQYRYHKMINEKFDRPVNSIVLHQAIEVVPNEDSRLELYKLTYFLRADPSYPEVNSPFYNEGLKRYKRNALNESRIQARQMNRAWANGEVSTQVYYMWHNYYRVNRMDLVWQED